ncbi:hypothetical protein DRP04_15095 [Archaeoglobales archaeon]|nr:MAG: hypothetical protein DRP04_15095 [Archaeoglobales archaeon]
MKVFFIDPFSVVLMEDKAFKAEKVDGNIFGGFCKCGGIMLQKAWVDDILMIAECERCWKVEAFRFNGRKFVERCDVIVIYRQNLVEFLRDILSSAEFEAIRNKAKNLSYNYNAFSRAKKKIEELKLNIDGILKILS